MAAIFIHLVWWGKSNCHTPETSEWTILIRTDCHYERENSSDDVDRLRIIHGAMPTRLLMMLSRSSNPLALMTMRNNARSPAINLRRRTSVEPNFSPEYDPGEPLQEERPQLTLELEKPEKRRRRRVRRGRASASSGRVRNYHHERYKHWLFKKSFDSWL